MPVQTQSCIMRLPIVTLVLFGAAIAQKDPHYAEDRTTMVHLFEWKFSDIADECERFLGPAGYAGVQVSPVNENLIIENRPWYERYQPISYEIQTRSGDEEEFRDMVKRCNDVGVRIFVDTVFNHMSGNQSPALGTAGNNATPSELYYPGVPYGPSDFHNPPCGISNYQDAVQVRDCELSGLHDLDQSKESVRQAVVEFLNKIVDAGVAGYRVDAAKHMWPADLEVIYDRVNNLTGNLSAFPYPENSRPFVYQEVIDVSPEAVSKFQYNDIAAVIEFSFGVQLGSAFRGQDPLDKFKNWGTGHYGLLPSEDALVMVDNHDNQRGHGAGGATILTYKNYREYKMALSFMLSHPYGLTRVMSSYGFEDPSAGPPAYSNGTIISPTFDENGICNNGWVCEHRWPQIVAMVKFRNAVKDQKLENWWSNGNNQIAFSRGKLGFVAFNAEKGKDLDATVPTGLPAGRYCDVVSGALKGDKCSGKTIEVTSKGQATVLIASNDENGVLAIHHKSKLPDPPKPPHHPKHGPHGPKHGPKHGPRGGHENVSGSEEDDSGSGPEP